MLLDGQKQSFLTGTLPLRHLQFPLVWPTVSKTQDHVLPTDRKMPRQQAPATLRSSEQGRCREGLCLQQWVCGSVWGCVPWLSVLPHVGHQPLHPPQKLAVYDLPGISLVPGQQWANQENYLHWGWAWENDVGGRKEECTEVDHEMRIRMRCECVAIIVKICHILLTYIHLTFKVQNIQNVEF